MNGPRRRDERRQRDAGTGGDGDRGGTGIRVHEIIDRIQAVEAVLLDRFDTGDGGFRVGLNPVTTDLAGQVIANWGEDWNFNGVLDPGEDRDPVNGVLDKSWNTLGGSSRCTKMSPTCPSGGRSPRSQVGSGSRAK